MSEVVNPDRSSVATASSKRSSKAEEVLEHSSFWIEARTMIELAVPTIIIHLSFVVPPFLTASYVGRHFGYVHLDGYTLANLTGNLMTLAMLQGIYNACDTLCPQAFGAGNFKEVGLLAIRGFVATLLVIIPTNLVLYLFMDNILVFLGQDAEASKLAWHFYMIYALSFPFYSLYTIVWKFLSSQWILIPLVVCTLLCSLVVLPVCLELFVRWFGFLGGATAITVFFIFDSLSVVAWVWAWKPHHPDTWSGLGTWREALAWEPFKAFFVLGIGGMLASFEWVYWEALALIIGTQGALQLSAHAIPTQMMFILFMFPLGTGIALAIRLGATISRNVPRAKLLVAGTLIVSFVLLVIASNVLYVVRHKVFRIFSNEAPVIELCDQVWFDVCLYFVLLGIFGVNVGIALGLGMQWTLGIVTVVCLWFLGMPASYYFTVVQEGGLPAAWRCIWPPYLLINVCMGTAFCSRDWEEISRLVRIREGLEDKEGGLESLALVESVENGNGSSYGTTGKPK